MLIRGWVSLRITNITPDTDVGNVSLYIMQRGHPSMGVRTRSTGEIECVTMYMHDVLRCMPMLTLLHRTRVV